MLLEFCSAAELASLGCTELGRHHAEASSYAGDVLSRARPLRSARHTSQPNFYHYIIRLTEKFG